MHALVTGASAGIGEGIAKQLGLAGYDLTLVARRAAELERVAEEITALAPGVRTRVATANLLELDGLGQLIADAEAELGPLDVLVNNAGVQIVGRTTNVTPEAGERLLTLNVFAPLRLTMAALPGMTARGRGTIVDIASLAALAPTPGMVHYSASKGALAAASEALRPELATRGIHVVTVYPGPIQTAMADAAVDKYAKDPTKGLPVGTADGLGRLVVRAIARRRSRVIYPRGYWFARWFPSVTSWVMGWASPLPK